MGLIKIVLPVVLAIAFWYILSGRRNHEVLVQTSDGQLRGAEFLDWLGGKFYAFQSIPYAKPPTGELRFKAPQPSGKWDGILDATKEIKKCIQTEFGKQFGEEDCLYLNVYTPEIPNYGTPLKPVMVYIHGGAFLEGSASMKRLGPEYLIAEDVVIAVINYRLGALGFMHLDGSDISPNNGMRDQVAALKWVQKNIAYFGGDPNLVTIFGESAGAASVDLLMLSPMAKGLFHRAIAQSGSALGDWMMGARNSARPFAKYLGIEAGEPLDIAEELRKIPYEDVFKAQLNTDWNIKVHDLWNGGLVIEGEGPNSFLPRDPKAIIQSGDFNRVPLLIGFTNREGILMEVITKFFGQPYAVRRTRDIPYSVSKGDKKLIENIETALNEEYFKSEIPREINEDVITMWSDIWFKRGVVNSARLHSAHHDTYLYEFSADTQMNFYKKKIADSARRPGASHVDDLGHLFKHDSSPPIAAGSIEETVVRKMVKLWTNFAKYGEPIHQRDDDLKDVQWPPVADSKLNFLNMTNEAFKAGIYKNKRIGFLNSLFNYR